jgi:hypothetical protein
MSAGSHKVYFDGSPYASGVYIAHAVSPSGTTVKKMLLLK